MPLLLSEYEDLSHIFRSVGDGIGVGYEAEVKRIAKPWLSPLARSASELSTSQQPARRALIPERQASKDVVGVPYMSGRAPEITIQSDT
jgi:hypothetical protein